MTVIEESHLIDNPVILTKFQRACYRQRAADRPINLSGLKRPTYTLLNQINWGETAEGGNFWSIVVDLYRAKEGEK
jgi:hypothetical protein